LTDPNSIKALAYERLEFIIVVGFLASYLLFRWGTVWITRFRVFILCACCLLFGYTYQITRPWMFFLQPLQRPAVDWTAVPVISSYGDWTHQNLSKSAVFLTGEARLWIMPRPVIFPNSPLLYPVFYQQGASLEDKLRRLAEVGVTHLIASGKDGELFPYRMSGSVRWAFYNEPDSDQYFREIFRGPQVPPHQDSVGFTFTETYVYEIKYPPHLLSVIESPIPRPWLYEYATAGILRP
jgi:hypothetical protein